MAVGSYISWSVQYRIPVFWCDTREYAERVTVRFLAGWMKHRSHIADKARQEEEAAERFKRENL